MIEIKEKDLGYAYLMQTLKDLKEGTTYARVGVLGKSGEDKREGVSLVDIATINEFGSRDGHVPERSFLRKPFDRMKAEYITQMGKLVKQVIERKMSVRRMLGLLGAKVASDVKKNITRGEGVPPPNAPYTIARKGSSRPLVDTGALVGAITHDVVMKSDE